MSSPPLYSDLGKEARNLFGQGFQFGFVKLDVKTKPSSDLKFSSLGTSNHESGKVYGSFEGQYVTPMTTLTTTWNTNNIINNTILLQNFDVVRGLKVSLATCLNATTGAKDGKVIGEYRDHLLALTGDVDINLSGPIVNSSVVVSHGHYTAGCQMAYDTAKSKLTKNNVGLVAKLQDFVIFANMNDNQIFGGSLYKKVNPSLECGLTLGWTAAANVITLGLGAKYQLDEEASVRAKINNSRQVGLGYSQRLREGVTLGLSALVDLMALNQGGHKVGLSLELEA